jgi:hypothetical protein
MKKYEELIQELEGNCPQLAKSLRQSHENRTLRLGFFVSDVRLRGLEELTAYLSLMASAYEGIPELKSIAFLIHRAQSDFVTALEATLTGLHTVAYDSMRDVMEIEFLLREFINQPLSISEWLTYDEKQRLKKFKPAALRERHAQRLGKRVEELPEASDYKGHSMFLHVSPQRNPFADPGIDKENSFVKADSCFWEIFNHAQRILYISYQLISHYSSEMATKLDLDANFEKFKEAHIKLQNNQASVWLNILGSLEKQNKPQDV